MFRIAWRVPCLGLRPLSTPPSNAAPLRSALRAAFPSWRAYTRNPIPSRRSFASSTSISAPTFRSSRVVLGPPPFSILARMFSTAGPSSSAPPEDGVQVRPKPFSAAEINAIFGKGRLSADVGNRALAVLQGRRVAGTLDLDLPADVTRSVHQSSLDTGLEWLRANYPLDEDAAIYARFEREEIEEEQRLIRRAEQLGLYKPQSGSYGAELGENNDPSGKSALAELRKRNEARILEEEERKRREWLEGEEREREMLKHLGQKNKALQTFDNTAALEGGWFSFNLT